MESMGNKHHMRLGGRPQVFDESARMLRVPGKENASADWWGENLGGGCLMSYESW